MALLINKDGKQLGPYSLDEARALVLSGTLSADDWAWPDGAKDWVMLKDVPGFVASKPPPPVGAAAGTVTASDLPPAHPASGEEELWRGHPSQWLNIGTYFFWLVALVGMAAIVVYTNLDFRSICGFGGVAIVALVHGLYVFMHLRATEYVVTTQRVRVISGLLGKDIQEIELFRVKDTMARQTLFLRLFGLGTITIISGDPNHPYIVLAAVPRAIELREQIRQEVMALRQRYGVREMDVM